MRRSLKDQVFSLVHAVDDRKGWSITTARRIIKLGSRSPLSLVIVSAPPISSLFGAAFAARHLGVPLVVDLRDPLFDDQPAAKSAVGRFDLWCRRVLERYVVRRAAVVVTTSPGLQDALIRRFPQHQSRIECIPNGFDGTPVAARVETGHRLVMAYAGALYMNRNPFPLLEALDRLVLDQRADANRIELILAGECEQYAGRGLRQWLATRACRGVVRILPRLAPAELSDLYTRATLLLNFAEGQPMQIPAKTFELLSLGRELLMFCEPTSDTAKVVTGLGAGVTCVESGEPAALLGVLRGFYERHVVQGRSCAPQPDAIRAYSRSAQNDRYRELLQRVSLSRPVRLHD